ncbi:MAG TPA: hypothetical protein VIJ36_02795 [Thermoanaerobaculia bacterium]
MKWIWKRFTPLLLLCLLALPLHAATRKVGLGTSADDERYSSLRQSVALLKDGTYATVWAHGLHDARMQWVRPDGSQVFLAGGINITTGGVSPNDLAVVANPAGGAFVAFAVSTDNGARLFVQSYDAGGNPRWPADGVFAANQSSGDLQAEPQLVAAPRGGVYLCFRNIYTYSPSGEGPNIVCQRFGADGQRLWTDQGILGADNTGEHRGLPKVTRDDRNGLLVFWRNNGKIPPAPDERTLIEGQHLAPDGTRLWGDRGRLVRATGLPADSGYEYSSLGVVPDGQGGAVVSFDDGTSSNQLDVFAQRVSRDGRLLWNNGVAVAAGSVSQGLDAVAAAPDGGAFVNVSQRGSGRLWLYRLGGGGKVLWKQRLAAGDPATSYDQISFLSFDNGRLRAVWSHFGPDSSARVFLAVYSLDGRRLNGPGGTLLTPGAGLRTPWGFVFDAARRQGLVVYDDNIVGNQSDFDAAGVLYQE